MSARKDRLPQEALAELSAPFGVHPDQLQELEAFENFVFQYPIADGHRILRVTQSHHRTVEDIQAELDWVGFLSAKGLTIASPISAQDGRHIVGSRDKAYLATAWHKVPGKSLFEENAKPLWCDTLYQEWGRTLGELHRLSRDYRVPPGRPTRWAWSQDRYLHNWTKDVGSGYPIMTRAWESTLEELSALPSESDYYGLIHADLHAKNFFWDNGKLQIFDTDDCQYNWYVADIASIFTSISLGDQAQPKVEEFVANFRRHFITGYESEFHLPQEELARLPLFLRFRELLIFGALCHRWNFNALSEAQAKLVSRLQQSIEVKGIDDD